LPGREVVAPVDLVEVDTVPAARQVWFAPAGARIRQWPALLASPGLAVHRPGDADRYAAYMVAEQAGMELPT